MSQTILQAATLVDILRYRAVNQPDAIAYTFLVDGETEQVSLTYQELEQKAQAIAFHLQSIYSPGETALLLYPPGLDYICAFFGCLYAGVVAVPAYPPRPNRSLVRVQAIVKDSLARVALTTQAILSNLERRFTQAPELKTLHWLATENINGNLAQSWQQPAIDGSTLAFLQYTSGSTAAPKGVMISHSNLVHNSGAIYQYFEHTDQSSVVSWLPMYHDMGLIGGILQPLYGGFPATLMSPLMFLQSPIRWLKAISNYRATSSGGPNFGYDLCDRKIKPEQLTNLDLSSWDIAFNGAEPINSAILERFATKFESCGFRREAFYPCYGMAEATLMVSGGLKSAPIVLKTVEGAALEQNQVVPASVDQEGTLTLVGCGQSLPDQQIVIVHPETLTPCEPGQVGEIWVSGPSIAQGYWNQPATTKHNFGVTLAPMGEKPFLRTGDLGFMLDGELFITGRLKDLIIINGRNHYPQDIEWTVENTHSLLRPTCSAGFSVNIAGEEQLVVIAEVERSYWKSTRLAASDPGNGAKGHALDTKELIRLIRRAVLQHHDLQVHTALLLKPGTIPKTSSGKIQRHACRQSFLAGTLAVINDGD
ncbi:MULTISPECIES: fatty acyl-AMP ligase [unclassified Moorena]|uniref:fatty acyl-AMP ligase n=1 Tax=unclassified Moorena TaxID=2683338 RepID=UPI0013C8BC8A|nr:MULTISPECIES: fatty acyl-AMP ligase [unclassified Moorena]NEO20617.1 fatty acyl-AMP ligase [Moorena sp. SIO4A5]NEQ58590.1 fatty acyl-AMP ligase [Moorena sp. SIO4A1]